MSYLGHTGYSRCADLLSVWRRFRTQSPICRNLASIWLPGPYGITTPGWYLVCRRRIGSATLGGRMQNQAATLFPDYRTFPATSPIRVSPRSRAHDFPMVSRAPMQLIYIGGLGSSTSSQVKSSSRRGARARASVR